ncbi:MAG: prepilin-type N-terminal cleavage/methylation domain-containing protein [Enterococcus sp.]|nr:prepilin-type N-terminal cleavage/methylation domain-containing protein [Enterococcus sp.]
MKQQSGFTLIELLVAMAVLGLIMGAMVHLFGSSVTSLHVGARQEVVYEEARLLMNELKTTLRYADKDSIKYPEPDVLTYSGTMWDRHMDISQGNNKAYNIRVEWQDAENGLKRLKVTRETDGKQETTLFPTDSANSVFKEGSQFPITPEEIMVNGSSIVMYKIVLPLQYMLNGKMQTQTLETKVVPSKEEVTETPEEKMRREYMEILNTGLKIVNGEKLSDKEKKVYDEVGKYYNRYDKYPFTNNDKIREYMCNEIYGGHWPSIDLTTSTGTKISSVWFQPVCFDMANVDNVFVMGREFNVQDDYSTWVGGWSNVRSIYDYKRKVWRTGTKNLVMSKNWNELEALMEKQNYQDVKKVEYK